MNKKIIIALLIVAAVMGMSSCDLMGGLFGPAYVGTWEQVTDNSKTIMVLEKDAWEMTAQVKSDDAWVDFMAMKGTMEGEDDALTLTATHVKEADGDWIAIPSEQVEEMSMGAVTWAVEDDKLTITFSDDSKLVLTEVK